MIVYHGSDCIVKYPDIVHSNKNLDFGEGFYTTTVRIQAERWAKRKAVLRNKIVGYVNLYEMKEISGLNICDFGDDLGSWIDFVCHCRFGEDIFRSYDIIKGKVADDKVFRVVDMYMRKIIDRDTALRDVKTYDTYDQIAFITQHSIDISLTYSGSFEVKL